MTISQTGLSIVHQLAEGRSRIAEIATALHRSQQQIRRDAQHLEQNGLVELPRGQIIARKIPLTNLLLRLLSNYPNLIPLLADSGLPILSLLLTPTTSGEISAVTKLKPSMIYRKLQEARQLSIVKKEKKQYHLNTEIWPELAAVLNEWRVFEQTVDCRVPADAIIYHKATTEILFSTKEKITAAKTAFSAYQEYGVKLLLPQEYYLLPPRKLTKQEIFLHSLAVTEKEKTVRHLLFLAIFYQKHRKDLSRIVHPLLQDIKDVLRGKSIKGHPSLAEIKEKMEIYQ